MKKTILIIIGMFLFYSAFLYSQQTTNYQTGIDPDTRTLDTGLPVGTTNGVYSVTEQTGAANYSVPITIPPGTMGMQPSITISYNSQSGNGLLGYGWNLSGLSAITRVGQDLYNEGNIKGVDFSSSDKFALDGNRLVLNSGTYGAAGSIYYTQNETFSKVSLKSYNLKSYFKVETKDGKIIRYGYDSLNCNSRIELGSSTGPVLAWLVTDITDKMGNYVRFYYHKDYTKNEFWIERIDYTGNTNTGLAPYNTINFYYETRADMNNVYIAGYKLQNNVILGMIKTFNEGSLVKTYDFEYTKDANNLYSVLNEIKETGSDGSKFNSIVVGQGAAGSNFQTSASNVVAGQTVDLFSGDYNNDGYSDIIAATYLYTPGTNNLPAFKYHTNLKLYLNNKNGSYNQTSTPITLPYTYSTIEGYGKIPNPLDFSNNDFNGDGQEDILISTSHINVYGSISQRTLDKFKIYWSQGNSFSTSADYLPNTFNKINANGKFLCTGDFDGDGASDFITILSDGNTYQPFMYSPKHWNPATGVYPYKINNTGGMEIHFGKIDKLYAIDFNGDGKDELMVVSNQGNGSGTPSTTQIFSFSSPSDQGPTGLTYDVTATLLYSSTTYLINSYETIPGDFNGDGKTDFLTCSNGGSWAIAYSAGTNFEIVPITFYEYIGYNHPNIQVKVGDYNGDGKSDILVAYNYFVGNVATTSRNNLYISNGISFTYNYNIFNSTLGLTPLLSGDFNGDGKIDEINRTCYTLPFDIFYFDKNGKELLTAKIADGLNFKTNINYSLLTNDAIYTKVANNGDVICIQKPINVVSSVSTSNGLGGIFTTSYKYEGLRVHYKGLGLLGFSKYTQSNSDGKIILYYAYNNKLGLTNPAGRYCNIYLSQKETKNSTNNPVSNEMFTNKEQCYGWKRIFSYTSSIYSKNYVSGIETNTSIGYYVSLGNLSQIITQYKSGTTVLALKSETYQNYIQAGSWCENKYQKKIIDIARYISGSSAITTHKEYTWDSNKGILLSEKDNDYNVTTSYTPDPNYGVITQVTTSGADFQNRTVNMEYDTKKRFVTKTTKISSPVNIVNEALYDSKFGNVIWSKDENGLITTNTYDGFGRIKEITLPTGKKITTTINWANGQGPANSLYYTKTEGNGSPYAMEYKDVLCRTLRKQTEGVILSGGNIPAFNIVIFSDNIYNTKGQLWKTSYLDPAGAVKWTQYIYNDPYDRLTSISSPVATKTYSYTTPTSSGTSVTETNTSVTPNQSKKTTTDLTGLVSSVADPGGTITYTYNGLEQPKTITGNGSTTTITYDNYGRQTYLTDPNAGQTHYEYYSNGELKKQTDAKGNVYEMTYDKLGRILTKYCSTDGTYTYNYDTETNGKGKVASITHTNGTSQQFKYDVLGRNYQFIEAISGTNFTTNYSFDDYGNITQITYPGGYSVTNSFDNIGTLTEVKQTSNNTSIWKLDAMNYMQQITQYKTANNNITTNKYFDAVNGNLNEIKTGTIFDYSYTFNPAIGNLMQRKDKKRSLTEDFTYDNLNRLKTSTKNGTLGLTTNYSNNGNIKEKSDVSTSFYIYNTTHPNAVEKIQNGVGNISNLTQTIAYNAFNKISQITEDATTNKLIFTYGVDQQRKKMQTYVNNNLTATKYYTAGFEREIAGSATTEWNYISGGDGLAAIYRVANGTGTLYWVAKDHLGSIIGLYNNSGTMVEEFSYDAWGCRRTPATWAYITGNPSNLITRGYTGHEHLDNFVLINMNGRPYDPVLGRMLSPDNYVQNASSTQSLNRYTYCNNNPLKYIDPDGNNPLLIAAFIGAIINVATQASQGNIKSFGGFWAAAGIGAGAGLLGGLAGMGATTVMASYGIQGGMLGGMAAGGAGGFAGGLSLGTANAMVFNHMGFGQAISTGGINMGINYGIMGTVTGGIFGGIQAYNNNCDVLTGDPLQQLYLYQNENGGTGTFDATHWDNDRAQYSSGNASDSKAREVYKDTYVHNEIDLRTNTDIPSEKTISIPKGYTKNLVVNYDRVSAGQQIMFNINNGQRIITTPIGAPAATLTINNVQTLNFSIIGAPTSTSIGTITAYTRVHIIGFYNPLKYFFR